MDKNKTEIITCLAQGGRIVTEDHFSYELTMPGHFIDKAMLLQLIAEGWIYSSNTSYKLTDAGKKAYLRSQDELGNGEMLPPIAQT